MILKASQRGGGTQLGVHLLKPENDHVEVHEVRGFCAEDVLGAMKEAQAVARGTRCEQFLFSVSLNPPETASVPVAVFERALDKIEEQTGLTGQPRIVVFHEKEGRRHCHAVWSRIDADTMTARPLPFFKSKLRDIAKGLYLEHGWSLPSGFMNKEQRDPRNFDLAQWQQAKRIGRDPKALREAIQECWSASDNRKSFTSALEQRGLYLAKGDRRAHVAVTFEGEVLSLSRMTGRKAKEIAAKLGPPDESRSVEETKQNIAASIAPKLRGLLKETEQARQRDMEPLETKRLAMKAEHREHREQLDESQRERSRSEGNERAARLRKGVAGIWDRLTGKRKESLRQNELETVECRTRDRAERHDLVREQLTERRGLQREIVEVRNRYGAQTEELHRDLARQVSSQEPDEQSLSTAFNGVSGASEAAPTPPRILRGRSSTPERGRNAGPEL